MPRVIHFEITADDPERAVKFYSDVFGWFVEKWREPEDYWQCSTGEQDEPGINGAIMRRPSTLMEGGTIETIGVTDIDDALERVVACGGEIVHGRTTIPYVGYQAYCRDTEGNLFGVMQEDAGARP